MAEKRCADDHQNGAKIVVPSVIDIQSWLDENEKSFDPPVCNKLLHTAGLLKIMFIGGPNQRKDYHIECGEELFYMVKGDMCLKVMECGEPKDIVIKEGEIFRLPSRVPHSPQRQADTVGLVMERDRDPEEMDCMRYYCEDQKETLWEEWFHCADLVKDFPPIIKRFFASEQCKTGKPIPGTIKPAPLQLREVHLEQPRNLKQWLAELSGDMETDGKATLYSSGEIQLCALSSGEHHLDGEMWLWQNEGESNVCLPKVKQMTLKQNSSLLVPANTKFTVHAGGILMTYTFKPRNGD